MICENVALNILPFMKMIEKQHGLTTKALTV
jgi:hypothetical protein